MRTEAAEQATEVPIAIDFERVGRPGQRWNAIEGTGHWDFCRSGLLKYQPLLGQHLTPRTCPNSDIDSHGTIAAHFLDFFNYGPLQQPFALLVISQSRAKNCSIAQWLNILGQTQL